MSNPDIKVPTVDSLIIAIPIAILFFLITLVIFQLKESLQYFKYILWIGFPIITLIIVSTVNTIVQYITCKTINMGKAILGGLSSVGTILFGLGISSIAYCRIPVASVFAPLMIGQTVNVTKNTTNMSINSLKNSNSKECCIPKLSLESIEDKYPLIEGLSYGFYIMFSVLFGMVIGTGLSTIC
jgi:amino acid transporter